MQSLHDGGETERKEHNAKHFACNLPRFARCFRAFGGGEIALYTIDNVVRVRIARTIDSNTFRIYI